MKLFICSILVLITILYLVFAENAFVSELFDYISANAEIASDLSVPAILREEILANIKEKLAENSFILSFAVGHDDLTAVLDYLADAERQVDGDKGQYLAAIDKLIRETEKLRISETLCMDGII